MKTLLMILTLLPLLAHAQPAAEGAPRRTRAPGIEESRAPRDRGQMMMDRLLGHLQRENPEEHARLTVLREEDPQAFREEIRGTLARLREQQRGAPRSGPFAQEVEAIRTAETPEGREQAQNQLQEAVARHVERRMEMREQRISAVRAQLEQLEEQHQADKNRRDELIQEWVERVQQHADESPDEE